ncbi:MAG: hypothetical protein Q8S73_10865, partial [Deltaproteobacteria bacterium]|nr:hypothetical protein [Deltaproteobacteria bacterium]
MIVARSLLVLALLGCASASAPAPEPTTAATARRRRRRRRPAVPSTAQCDALRAESRATVARALGARPATAWP